MRCDDSSVFMTTSGLSFECTSVPLSGVLWLSWYARSIHDGFLSLFPACCDPTIEDAGELCWLVVAIEARRWIGDIVDMLCELLCGHLRTAGPLGLRGSKVSHSSPRRTQLRHLGVVASHRTFRLRHCVHASDKRPRFDRGGLGEGGCSCDTASILARSVGSDRKLGSAILRDGKDLDNFWILTIIQDGRRRDVVTFRPATQSLRYRIPRLGSIDNNRVRP